MQVFECLIELWIRPSEFPARQGLVLPQLDFAHDAPEIGIVGMFRRKAATDDGYSRPIQSAPATLAGVQSDIGGEAIRSRIINILGAARDADSLRALVAPLHLAKACRQTPTPSRCFFDQGPALIDRTDKTDTLERFLERL